MTNKTTLSSSALTSPRRKWRLFLWLLIVFMIGILSPDKLIPPVANATQKDWNPKAFWYEPWGPSGVHKGIDIFGTKGQLVIAPTYGLILWVGEFNLGGKFVVMRGLKWRLHYFAHLDNYNAFPGLPVMSGQTLGQVGNAQGKPMHLHYTILTLLPYPWQVDSSTQGWKKMFYLDPNSFVRKP